ncbi:MAG: arylsulfatase [Paludibacteraceae bacterium]|nr:arylsulfatase [Paludibacteraceae bacterium]
MKKLLLSTPIGIFAGLMTSCAPSAKQNQPNIIVILADDLGYGDVSAQGATEIQTPNLDRLANGGIRFTNGYATSATSTPSRYALMTGMYPWKNKDAKILPGDAPLIINPGQYTLPKMMQEAGYTTAAIGKWHLGMGAGNVNWNETVRPNANDIGFDYSNLIAATNDRVPTVFVENGNVVGLDPTDPIQVSYESNFEGEPTAITHPERLKMHWAHGHNQSIHNGIPRIGYQKGGKSAMWVDEDMADYFTGLATKFISENKEKPFFMYFGLHQPHVPRTPNARFVGKSGMGPRGDAILEADWCVGELMAHLEKEGLLENTIIIFTSDNGPVLNDGYKDGAAELVGNHKPAGTLRGGKYSLFDAGTRVPFFVYWKGKIKPKVSDALVCQLDIMASVASLVNKPLEGEYDSQDLLPVFMGDSDKGRTELIVEANGKMALRSGDWAFIPPYSGPETNLTGNELGNLVQGGLYNLSTDPGQTGNVMDTFKDQFQKMKSRFLAITKEYYRPNTDEIELK